MFPLLIACFVLAVEGYFLPPLHPAQPSAIRGQTQGNEFYPEYNKIEENLNYNNRFLFQSPHHQYQQFADSQRFYTQSAANHAYGPPHLQQLQYQQPEQLAEPVYSDVRGAPSFYVQPHDEETTRQQTLTVSPQYLGYPSQASPNSPQQASAQQSNFKTPSSVPGLQTTAQTTIPVLIRVSDNQALIVPVRAVYALPGFLERLVQRVQGYYSVYNPVENLVVDRPYYVSTGSPLVQQQPLVLTNGAESGVEPMKGDLVQDAGQSSPDSTELASQSLGTRIKDLKQEEMKDDSTTTVEPEEMKEGTTEASTEEMKDSTNKPDSEANDTNDVTTPPTSADETTVTEITPSTSSESTISSTASDVSTTVAPSTNKPEEPNSPEDNSADLESAGYTYYRPAIPFYYPTPK